MIRSKGETEIGLAKLGYSDSIAFRPGFLAGAQRKDRPLENIFGSVRSRLLVCPLSEYFAGSSQVHCHMSLTPSKFRYVWFIVFT